MGSRDTHGLFKSEIRANRSGEFCLLFVFQESTGFDLGGFDFGPLSELLFWQE